ncbi:hypothetical protein [Hyphococcus sp.]|uniref:hypothetical protein n=1 Tax=Hyphococcus sp. TaxID=2038636 RepID=UPI002084E36F|nr:MAG: hypothetical protein DHS20C04_23880 [Marinicaulis sp.]
MALAVSPYASGRAGAAAITPLRSASPDRKTAGSLSQEETPTLAESTPREDNTRNSEARARELAGTLAKVTAGRPRGNAAPPPDAETAQAAKKPAADLQREEIKKLEVIRANALYPAPATAEARSIAQLAHTQIIRAQAGLRAFESAEAQARADRISAAQFTAQRAAEAYRQLEEFDAAGVPYSV